MYISREIEDQVCKLAGFYPVVTLTGPRQSGNVCWASAHPNKFATHPLLGHLFENMVMSEALKCRLNRGRPSDLYFYRNSSGSIEVDLLLEEGNALYPREIKSSSTYSQSMSAGLKAFASLTAKARDPLVVYSYSSQRFPSVAVHYADAECWCRT